MKRVLIIIALFLMAALVCASGHDILTITHYSKNLDREKTFKVFFPPNAKPDDEFPVLFVLHGAWGSCEDWVERTDVEDLAENYRMILVFPDGSPFGWYVDSPIEENMQYETYVSQELVKLVDQMFPTVGTRNARGIMGLSMGGHGAFLLSAKHPDVFGSASSLSGIMKITNHPGKWHIAGRLGTLEDHPEAWKENSVWDQAELFVDADVDLLFDCGEDDTKTGAIGDARQLHDRLKELEVPHIWREMPGTHSWDYWNEHLEEHLNFHQAAMLEQTPGMGKWRGLYFERLGKFYEENASLPLNPPEKTTISLLGSSSMHGFPRELLSEYHVFNRGISADTLGIGTRDISHRLESSVFDMDPDYIFIKNGRNDLGNRHRNGEPSIQRMMEEYEDIVTKIRERHPEGRIYIVTCAPVRGRYAHLAMPTYSYNMELKTLAQKHEIPVIDLFSELEGEEHLLKEKYSHDGLHISPAGYEKMADLMIKAIEEPDSE